MDIGVYGSRGIPSTYGGFETFLTALLPLLVQRGHSVTIYCRDGDVPHLGCYKGVRQCFVPSLAGKATSTLSHGLLSAGTARLRRHDAVLVVNAANSPFCLLQRLTGQRVVLNTDGQEWLRGKWGRVAKTYFRLAARTTHWAASGVITDSLAMAHIFRDTFHTASSIIPYAWTELNDPPDLAALASLGLSPLHYSVAAGRLVPENGLERIATSYLATNNPNPLVILGTANYNSPTRSALAALAERNTRLRLLGHISDRHLFATLVNQSTCYIHAHSVGGINPALLEAMGLGATIVALDTPFNSEALGSAGILFSDFGPSLTRVLEELPTSSILGGLAKIRVHEEFLLTSVADAYEQLLLEVCHCPARHSTVLSTRWGRGEHLRKRPDDTNKQALTGSGRNRTPDDIADVSA